MGDQLKATNLKRQTCDEFIELSGNQVLGNGVDFMDIMNVFPNILAKNQNFKKLRHRRWKSTDNNDINIFLSLENPCTFLLAKEKTWKGIFNTNTELSQKCTEKKIMPLKTAATWLFNDIWCYLVIGCFD